ncbi:helix-turn-helix transcriptional regulator [Rhodoferax sp. GW822-FHT02A01]|uniref:helix-turn-helix domain-containing protein n=1 Tax=Rhodoferax sp. GW822-FHT02A01 TaxID=3141537 RepID=UPI00315D648A
MYELVYISQYRQMAMSLQQIFGNRVRELRTARGFTQEDLAEKSGFFRTYISRVETGEANPTLTMIHALAGSLRVDVTDLFDTGPMPDLPVKKTRLSRGRVVK